MKNLYSSVSKALKWAHDQTTTGDHTVTDGHTTTDALVDWWIDCSTDILIGRLIHWFRCTLMEAFIRPRGHPTTIFGRSNFRKFWSQIKVLKGFRPWDQDKRISRAMLVWYASRTLQNNSRKMNSGHFKSENINFWSKTGGHFFWSDDIRRYPMIIDDIRR